MVMTTIDILLVMNDSLVMDDSIWKEGILLVSLILLKSDVFQS